MGFVAAGAFFGDDAGAGDWSAHAFDVAGRGGSPVPRGGEVSGVDEVGGEAGCGLVIDGAIGGGGAADSGGAGRAGAVFVSRRRQFSGCAA